MLSFFFKRPIGLTTLFLVWIALGAFSFYKIPISLLPDIQPSILRVAVKYPGASPETIERDIGRPLREALLTLTGISDVESVSYYGSAALVLKFQNTVSIPAAYLSANEKIDEVLEDLPKDLERPTIVASSGRDIPLVRIQVISASDSDFLEASTITSRIIRRKLEQISGVGFVDISGLHSEWYSLQINSARISELQLTDVDVIASIREIGRESGAIEIVDGAYTYNLKIRAPFETVRSILQLPVKLKDDRTIKIKEIADVVKVPVPENGSHVFGTRRALVIAIYPQGDSRTPELLSDIKGELAQLSMQFPQVSFEISQDQSALLDLSIQNLKQAIIWGGISAFLILFFFTKGWREPLLIGINLPLSLILSLYLLYSLGLSINIISLGALSLGLGMMVDNTIVVIDNITQSRFKQHELIPASIKGTEEVMLPILGSTLTNLAVFVPLLILNGVYGDLLRDQAITITVVLAVSMLSTFILTPILYVALFRKASVELTGTTRFFRLISSVHELIFNFFWKRKMWSVFVSLGLLATGAALIITMDRTTLPQMDKLESLVVIDWNEPINAEENRHRITNLLSQLHGMAATTEADIGIQDFLMSSGFPSVQHAEIYIRCSAIDLKNKTDAWILSYVRQRFPKCILRIENAKNPFDQIIDDSTPYLEARLRNSNSGTAINGLTLDSIFQQLDAKNSVAKSIGFRKSKLAMFTINPDVLASYNISYRSAFNQLKLILGGAVIVELSSLGSNSSLIVQKHPGDLTSILGKSTIRSGDGTEISLSKFVDFKYDETFSCITADKAGPYYAVNFSIDNDVDKAIATTKQIADSSGAIVSFSGRYFDDRGALWNAALTTLVSFLLIYLILTAEFESLKIPFLVIIALPLGLSGSLILLWICGGTINVMSAIGLVIVVGILDNDVILKIDRINRLRLTADLETAIAQAGRDRLKPIVLNTCTNIVALIPIIFTSGLGSDLQKPIAITSIGGLFIGTFAALYIIPLVYWYAVNLQWSKKIRR